MIIGAKRKGDRQPRFAKWLPQIPDDICTCVCTRTIPGSDNFGDAYDYKKIIL